MAQDPVCKMNMEESTAAATATYEGKTYYFCSESCKARFVEKPAEYVAKGGPSMREVRPGVWSAIALTSVLIVLGPGSGGISADEGRHQMAAEVEVANVDLKGGWIDAKTSQGTMKLHFPPAALANVTQGQRIAVDLHFEKKPNAGGMVGDASYQGHHMMEGTITRIDATSGWVDVKTPEGTMVVHFLPPRDVAGLKQGDSIMIALSFKPCPPAPAQCLGGRRR